MKTVLNSLILVTALMFSPCVARAQVAVSFNFDDGPLHSPTPLDLTSEGVAAHFTASGDQYSIQQADTLGFTPIGFSGYCIYPGSVFLSDLLISFDHPLTSISMLYAPEEYDTDSSATVRITAFSGATLVGTNTHSIDPPGTWPTGTLSFSTSQTFDNVVVHYALPPVTGGDWGPIFMVDNLMVTVVPEPATWTMLAGVAVLLVAIRRVLIGRNE